MRFNSVPVNRFSRRGEVYSSNNLLTTVRVENLRKAGVTARVSVTFGGVRKPFGAGSDPNGRVNPILTTLPLPAPPCGYSSTNCIAKNVRL